MWLLKYLVWIPLVFLYRLLRDWWRGIWKKLRPTVVHVVGWGVFAAVVLLLLTIAPELSGAILNLALVIGVLYLMIHLTLFTLPGGGRRKKKK